MIRYDHIYAEIPTSIKGELRPKFHSKLPNMTIKIFTEIGFAKFQDRGIKFLNLMNMMPLINL